MEEKMQKIPDYTPNYVKEQFKVYIERKDTTKYEHFLYDDVVAVINYAKTMRNITEEQAKELKDILNELR